MNILFSCCAIGRVAVLIPLLLGVGLFADITIDEIRTKPPSLARNFMIWQYFDQNITSRQADEAFYLIRNVNRKLFFAYAKKSKRPEVSYTVKCMKMNARSIIKSTDTSCIKIAVNIGKLSQLSDTERIHISKLVDDKKLSKAVAILNEKNISKNYHRYPPDLFLKVFNGSSGKFRRNMFNFSPDYDYMRSLAESPGFTSALMSTVNDPALHRFAKAFILVNIKKLDAKSHFYLGLNQLMRGEKSRAIEHFQLSRDKAYYQEDKDKALFWQALVSKNDLVWDLLAKSWDINFYSLYAKEKTGIFPDNYYTHLQTSKKSSSLNISDPFIWNELLEEIKKTPKKDLYDLAEKYNAPNLTPVQSFIVERASGFRLQGYIMPYDNELKDIDDDTKAIVYALMRQESRFIPSALSGSFALGLMQIMPFLCRAMDGDVDCGRKEYNEMFDPHVNLLYAKPHIKWLKKRVYHPLFIAYAYNGGIGFTKRHLQNGTFKKEPYEPFLSMELMRRTETREYGKKVLANYIIYKRIIGDPVSLIGLCNDLTEPSKTDRFR